MLSSNRRPDPSPTTIKPDELWRTALAELRLQMTKATFDAWLADSQVIVEASTPTMLVIAVSSIYAQEWLTHRLQTVIVRAVTSIAGQSIAVRFLHSYAKGNTMNPLEDRLHKHAAMDGRPSCSDTIPSLAVSQEQLVYLEQKLIRAGIVPTSPIQLPTNITSELLNVLLTEGDEPMITPPQPSPTRVRIHSHITQSRFLHVEDALNIGKLRLFAGNYRRNEGTDGHAYHFIDLADARVVFSALARGEQGFNHKEYKGTPPQKNGTAVNNRTAVSRVLSIAIKGENAYIELKTGPGKLTDTGAITPNGKPEVEVNVSFKLYEARRLAASVLAYVYAWDVMRMMVNRHLVSQPVPYLLVPTTSETNDSLVPSVNGTPQSNGVPRPSAATATHGRTVTRQDPVPTTMNADASTTAKQANGKPGKSASPMPARSVNGQPVKSDTAVISTTLSTGAENPLLQYGNGAVIDQANLTEVQTFQRYIAEKKTVPESKPVLLDYYRQRGQAPVIST